MTVAASSLSDLGYARESVYGTAPTGVRYSAFRRKSAAGLNLTKDSYDSEEIRVDRQLSDSRHGIRRVVGDLESEVSAVSYDVLIAALLGADTSSGLGWTTTNIVLGTGLSTTGWPSTGRMTLAGTLTNHDLILPGDELQISASNNASFELVPFGFAGWSGGAGTVLQTDGRPATAVGSVMSGATITAINRRCTVGANVTGFTFERAFTDLDLWQSYTGCRINSATFSCPPTGLAGITWNIMGQNASELRDAPISTVEPSGGVVYTAVSDSSPLAAVGGVLSVQVGSGNAALMGTVTELNFTIDNQMGGAEVIGQNYMPDVLFGNTQLITGKMTVLFENSTIYNVFEGELEASLYFKMRSPGYATDHQHLTFFFPRMKFNSGNLGDAVATGLPVEIEFRVLRPTAATSTLFKYATHVLTQQVYVTTQA